MRQTLPDPNDPDFEDRVIATQLDNLGPRRAEFLASLGKAEGAQFVEKVLDAEWRGLPKTGRPPRPRNAR